MAFLGHIVSGEGIWVDTQKIEAVKNWPRPISPTDINRLLGLDGYYRRFKGVLSYFSSMTQKIVNFNGLKLVRKDFENSDVSKVGLGYISMQYGNFIVYASS